MTVRKHFKQLVRERMKKTGESYTSARRHLITLRPPTSDSRTRWHFAGNVPATTALRVVLSAAGAKAPHTGEPFTEAMLFGIAGGVGAGVCAFNYAKEGIATFYIAGRHAWQDDLSYIEAACNRLGITPTVRESSSVKKSAEQLREALANGPCIAWVDQAHLPHRAMPAAFSGGCYHVITIYRIDDAEQSALIGDLMDHPVAVPLTDLATARARIRKQKNRLLSMAASAKRLDLKRAVREGLKACHTGLTTIAIKGYPNLFSLGSFRKWADRLHGSKDKDSWETIFPPGRNLWTALTGMYLYGELYGTGGGLCRPIMSEFLNESGTALKDSRLLRLAEQYAKLGAQWRVLFKAALPDNVPLLGEARRLYDQYAELFTTGGSLEDKQKTWVRLDELAKQAAKAFPLSAKEAADLRATLQEQLRLIVAGEEDALSSIASYLA